MSKTTISLEEIQNTLAHFSGSEEFHRVGNSLITEGVHYLSETCGSYWLIDIINSIQWMPKLRAEGFQVFNLTVFNNTATVVVSDGNQSLLYFQKIDHTDFPLERITLWRVNDTVMLTSEY